MASFTEELIDSKLLDLHTAIPGRIEAYDPDTQKADVKPLIKSNFFDDDGVRVTESLPIITDVPVLFPGAGGFRFTFPVNRGDKVLLVFSESSLDKLLSSGEEVDPEIYSRHELSDAIAIPGFRDFRTTTAAHSSAMVLESSSQILLGSKTASDGVIKGNSRDTSEQVFLDALKIFSAATLAPGPAKTAFGLAVDIFKSAASAAVSTKVRVD